MTAQDYLVEHGINETSIKRFHITWDESQVNIPIKNKEDQIIWVKHRNLNYTPDDKDSKKYINDLGSKVSLFNIRSHHDKKDLILTEGEVDAIKLDQEGIPAISNTGGAGTFNKELADQLINKNIYICYDNDKPGTEGIKKVLDFLPTAKIIELPLDSHDICDFFTLHTKKDFIEILKQAKTKGEWERKYQPIEYKIITLPELQSREFPEEEWIIDKVLPSTGFTMFVGESGTGKSFIALEMVRAITSQTLFLDHFEVKQNVPILIIDKENGLRRIKKRSLALGIKNSDQVYLLEYPEKFSLTEEEFMQTVANFILEKGVKVIILDSFIDFLVGSESDSVEISKVFTAFRSISQDVVYIPLHHDSKPVLKQVRTALQKTRGSGNIAAQLDNQFYIEKTKSPTIMTIEQGKSRDMEPVTKFSVQMVNNEAGEMTGFKYLGEIQDAVKAIEEAQELVYQFLAGHPESTKDDINGISDNTGISTRTIKDALSQLNKKGIIDSITKSGSGNKRFYFITGENQEGSESEKFLNDTTPYLDPNPNSYE